MRTKPKRRERGTAELDAFAQHGVKVGRLLPGSTVKTLLVEVSGDASGPQTARTTVALDAAAVERAVVSRQPVVIVFENGDPALPIVTGMIQPPPVATPLQELLVGSPATNTDPNANRLPTEARLDGKRVILEGKDEVVLKCGDASVTLKRDGKVILRGAYVETHAKGVNRIKGGSVKIN